MESIDSFDVCRQLEVRFEVTRNVGIDWAAKRRSEARIAPPQEAQLSSAFATTKESQRGI